MRAADELVTLYRALQAQPYAYDFFQALRRIECLNPAKPRLGTAARPQDEPVRLGQEPSLAFPQSTLSAFTLPAGAKPPRMEVRFFGLLGPNGPLPLHLTEHARERLMHAGDTTFGRFLDVFHHRFLLMFYRAWAQAQPTVSFDRPRDDRFTLYVGSLIGLGAARARDRDPVEDHAKLYFAGWLARQVRNAEGLAALLQGYFRVPVRVEEFVGHWMQLPRNERTRLAAGNDSVRLGGGAVLGGRVWDRQHKFRLWLGPLTLEQYEGFLPGGQAIGKLLAWVRQYLCLELEWDVRLALAGKEVPRLRLGRGGRLGWTSWLGGPQRREDAADLTLNVERLVVCFASRGTK